MNIGPKGMLASELIAQLQAQIRSHGDRPVYHGGGDYPEGVTVVSYNKRGDPYVPPRSFRIR